MQTCGGTEGLTQVFLNPLNFTRLSKPLPLSMRVHFPPLGLKRGSNSCWSCEGLALEEKVGWVVILQRV